MSLNAARMFKVFALLLSLAACSDAKYVDSVGGTEIDVAGEVTMFRAEVFDLGSGSIIRLWAGDELLLDREVKIHEVTNTYKIVYRGQDLEVFFWLLGWPFDVTLTIDGKTTIFPAAYSFGKPS